MLHNLDQRLQSGDTLIGTWLYLNDIGVAEIVAASGFDFVMIDMEHSPTGFDNLRNLIMAVERHTLPVVRVKANSPEFITAILDLGPAAVMVPRINTAAEAAAAVQHAKYAPLGSRGFGPYRVSDYTRNMPDFLAQANAKQLLWVQIEHHEAVKNIEEIVKVEGIDACFIGLGDLSASLGHLGNPGHPEVVEQARHALQVIRDAGLPAGSAFGSGDGLNVWQAAGMSIFTVAADFRFVVHGAGQYLNNAKAVLGQ